MARFVLFTGAFFFLFVSSRALAQAPSRTGYVSIQTIEVQNYQNAQRWAKANNYPVLQTLSDHSTVGIVAMELQHPVFFTTHNREAGVLTQTSLLHPGQADGFSLNGRGLSIGLWDAGAVHEKHQELEFRVINKDMGSKSNHSTHVAGTLIASGVHPEALGMAPLGSVIAYNWNFHTTEMQDEAKEGLLVSNHSYGRIGGWHLFAISADSSRWQWFGDPSVSHREDYIFGFYDRNASLFDEIAYSFPYYLPVVSAGNEQDDSGPESGKYLALDANGRWTTYDVSNRPIQPDGGIHGYDTITSMAVAKNVLTVGSVAFREGESSFFLSEFSSMGPTDDGRIKPDIVGIGEQLFSSIATGEESYAIYSGTSMATPNVAGSLILLQELAQQLFINPLTAASIKGLVIHTADDIGAAGPDYRFGWGLLNTTNAAKHLEAAFQNPSLLREGVISTGEIISSELLLNERSDIRITLSWTDPPATPLNGSKPTLLNNRTPSLINDLDLKLIRQSTQETYYPYALSPDAPGAPASTGVNYTDPVEQIFVPFAPPGLYTLVINSKQAELLNGKQEFSLLISGLATLESPITLDTSHVQSDIGQVILNWETASESTNGSFVIERANVSHVGPNSNAITAFETLATLSSKGNTDNANSYQYIDGVSIQGVYQYRILFREDNRSHRTLVAEFMVDMPAPEKLDIASIYPNPTRGQAQFILDLPNHSRVGVDIYDLLGRRIHSIETSFYSAGRYSIPFDATGWSPGVYFVAARTEKSLITNQFIVIQ